MKNSILYKVYLKRVMSMVVAFSVMIYLISGNQDVFEGNLDTIFYTFGIAMIGVTMFAMLRMPKDYDFVNALPVTKGKQWISVYMAAMTVIGILYFQYIVFTCIKCYQGKDVYGEIIASGLIKAMTTGFVMTLLMWILSHTDVRFSPKVLFGVLIIIAGGFFMAEFTQKAFDLKSNSYFCELINRWFLMTVPYKVINTDLDAYYVDYYSHFTMMDKIATVLVYLVIILPLTAVLARFTYKNYGEMNLAKDRRKGNHKNFNRVLAGVFASLVTMSGLAIVGKIIEYNNVVIDGYYGFEFVAEKNGELFFSGSKYQFNDSMSVFVNKYDVDFPEVYQYCFIGAVVVSLVVGCAVAIWKGKKKEVAE